MASNAPNTASQTRGNMSLYPGWVARCQHCDYEIDLESLGWVRRGAYSYGKRSRIYCETCRQHRFMQIVHVDQNGEPDQSLGKVLAVVFGIQAIVWTIVLTILYFVFREQF